MVRVFGRLSQRVIDFLASIQRGRSHVTGKSVRVLTAFHAGNKEYLDAFARRGTFKLFPNIFKYPTGRVEGIVIPV
jgi:hypothetical protein